MSAAFQFMRGELEKNAQFAAEDLPWYTTAAGATGGTLTAGRLLPKKYRALGQVGGALLGTGAGLAVGKPLAKKLEKKASEDTAFEGTEESGLKKPPHPALTAAKTVGGLGVGMLAGYGGMKAVDEILKHTRGRGLPRGSALMWAVPLVTGAGGLAYNHLQQQTLEKMRRDHLMRQAAKQKERS